MNTLFRVGLVVPVRSTLSVSPGSAGGVGRPPLRVSGLALLGVTLKVSLLLPPLTVAELPLTAALTSMVPLPDRVTAPAPAPEVAVVTGCDTLRLPVVATVIG